ncbi:DUF5018 domain-containing protein [Treponema sp. R6D11]
MKNLKNKFAKISISLLILIFAFIACDGSDGTGDGSSPGTSQSSTKTITDFTFASPAAIGIINETAKTIAVTVPYGTNVTALTPNVKHTGVNYSPTGAQNFTNPVPYTVTAENGTTQKYTVTVTVASISAKAITGFTFASPEATGIINEAAKTIAITVPYGTNVTALTPKVTHTGASYSPTGAQNFTSPVNYIVRAYDNSTQNYTVTVNVAPSNDPIVILNSVTQNGSSMKTTTQLTLTFSQEIAGLSADDITLSGVQGGIKGTLSASGATYTLPIYSVYQGGELNVEVTKQGYIISGSPQVVTIYYATLRTLDSVTQNGSATQTTTQLTLTFLSYGDTLTADDITLSGLPNVINKGTLSSYSYSGGKYTYTLPISGNNPSGTYTIEVAVAKQGYEIIGSPKTVTVYIPILWTAVSDTTFGTSTINGIAHTSFSSSLFVAVGASGKAAYSADGINWTAVSDTTFGTTAINAIVGSKRDGPVQNRFVAVGDSGKAAYSTNGGVTWTAVSDTTFGTTAINSIAWGKSENNGNGKYVAVGASGKAAYSSDGGVTWAAVDTKFGTTAINAITWGGTDGNEKYVAVGDSGKAAYSVDGVIWTAIGNTTFGTSEYIYAIARNNDNNFVAVGRSGKAAYWNGNYWSVNH